MNRTSKTSFLILCAVWISLSACRGEREEPVPASEEHVTEMPVAQQRTGMPPEFVAGTYDMIGRYPDSDQIYTGTVEIDVSDQESNALSVTRVIGGNTIRGKGIIITTAGDAVTVMRVEFEGEAGLLEATYQVESDLDNYARLTGYVYAKNGGTSLPGIEALFHDHYR